MRRVDLIRRLSGLVLRVEQPRVLRVPQQEVGDTFTTTSHCHVKWVVTALACTENINRVKKWRGLFPLKFSSSILTKSVKIRQSYNTMQYKSYLVHASYKKTVHWLITEFII